MKKTKTIIVRISEELYNSIIASNKNISKEVRETLNEKYGIIEKNKSN